MVGQTGTASRSPSAAGRIVGNAAIMDWEAKPQRAPTLLAVKLRAGEMARKQGLSKTPWFHQTILS